MRVIHLLRKYDPSEWGGTETAIQRLFEGLGRHGVTSLVYGPRIRGKGSTPDPLKSVGCEVKRFRACVPVWGISRERKRQLVAVGGNLMSFDLLPSLCAQKKISLIHAHALGRIGGIGRTAARMRKVPLVVTIHGGVLDLPKVMKDAYAHPKREGWEWGRIFGALFRAHTLLKDANAIVTCNPKESALWQEKFPSKRIVIQPHGVPQELYQKDQRLAARAAFPQLVNRRILLSAGRLDPVKNQGWLIEQAPRFLREHPGTVLVLAGACTDEPYRKAMEHRIKELGINDHVVLTGGLPPGDPRLIGLLQQAEVLLLPSVSETFGLVLLEAWAAGTAVMSSRTSGASALIVNGYNGWLFDLDQPGIFHEALGRTLSEPALRSEQIAHGAALVAAGYNTDTLAGRMKELYETLIQENHALRNSARR
jgi:alpha-maltose-1-phosphate synthase